MNLSEAALLELISLARQRGGISMEDLRKALPIDSMTEADVAHVVARLDEAGFDVEIDPTLLLPEGKVAPNSAKFEQTGQTGLPETVPGKGEQRTSFPASAGEPILKQRKARSSEPTASAPVLPWVIAFAIVVLAVFAAFAF